MSSIEDPNYLKLVFEKVVSETDVKHRLAYPVEHLNHICPDPYASRGSPTHFKIIDLDGNPYYFRLTLRQEGNLKPEITGEWKDFVRAKGLKPYDRLVFNKHTPIGNGDGVVFTVAVLRALTVFGQPQLPC